jgi:mannose-1-phosphate guanylyltransferase
VKSFKEKPSRDVAEQYLLAGNYLWNAGIFVWNVGTITDAIGTYKPNIAADMERMKTPADVQTVFPQCEKISIDYAVMEPAAAEGKVYTHPADFGWSDLGNWASLHDKLQHDDAGNGTVGNVHLYECSNCVVHAEEAGKVVLQGLDGYIVSAKGDRLLVCRRSEEQRIREFSGQ